MYHFSNNHLSTISAKFPTFLKYVSKLLFSSFTTFSSCETENLRIPFKYCLSPVTLMGTDCFTITQKKEWRLNSDTGRATESYKLCLQEQPAPPIHLCCAILFKNCLKKKDFSSKGFQGEDPGYYTFIQFCKNPRTCMNIWTSHFIIPGILFSSVIQQISADQFQADSPKLHPREA